MKLLLENWIADATVESCGMQFENFYAIAEFVAATHDIGKATSYFQAIICKKVPILYDNIVSSGLIVCENMLHRGKTPHSYAGQWILQSDTVSINLPESVANVIGATSLLTKKSPTHIPAFWGFIHSYLPIPISALYANIITLQR